jgi:uncharacterized protein YjiS (DUF1127 family)
MRGLDLTIAWVKEATGDTLNVLSLLKRYLLAFGAWQRRRSQTALHDLSDRELMDIGVTRGEIDHIAPHRAIDALRDSIHSRGVI